MANNKQNIESFLTCVDCQQYFGEKGRSPHVLPCLHTVCSNCLKRRIENQNVKCPDCNETFEARGNDISAFPIDSGRRHVVDCYRVQKKSAEFYCNQCHPNKVVAASRCKDCDEFLCKTCSDAHNRTKLTKRHVVLSLDMLKESPLEDFHNKLTCTVEGHEGQPFSHFCESRSCNKPICSLCLVQFHQRDDGHDVKYLNDVYVEKKRIVENNLLDIRHKKTKVDEAIDLLNDEVQNLYLKESSIEQDIEQAFTKCFDVLDERKAVLKQMLSDVSGRKKNALDLQLDELSTKKDSIDQAIKFSEDHLAYSNGAEFLIMKDQIISRTNALRDQQIDTTPHTTAEMAFELVNMEDEFREFGKVMGDIWATAAYVPKTRVQTFDISMGKEQVVLIISPHDSHNRPINESGIDIKVDILDSKGKRYQGIVVDHGKKFGSYKVYFTPVRSGEHRAYVTMLGLTLSKDGFGFMVNEDLTVKKADLRINLKSTSTKTARKSQPLTGKMSDRSPDIRVTSGMMSDTDADSNADRNSNVNEFPPYRAVGEIICPEFSFDLKSTYHQYELSEDYKTLINQKSRRPPSRDLSTAFQNYRGTIATKPLGKTNQHYFECSVHFFVKRQLRQDLIFEIGIARKSEVDMNYTLDNHALAWTFCARRCNICRTICLQCWNNGQRLFHTPATENSPPGTTHKTTYGFLLDTRNKQWIVVDAKSRKFIFRFRNVDVSRPLWPTFGVYNPDLVNVTLNLRSGQEITTVLEVPFDL